MFFVWLRVKCISIIQRVSNRIYPCIRQSGRTLKGFGELFPCLVLTEREERGLPCEDPSVYLVHCYRVMRLEVIPKIIRWCGDGTLGGVRCCRIYECSVGNGQIIVVPALRLLFRWLRWPQSSFCSWSFRSTLSLRLGHCISSENIYNTYDTRRLPYVGDPSRVDNGFDQPSGYGLGVGKAALRGTRLS